MKTSFIIAALLVAQNIFAQTKSNEPPKIPTHPVNINSEVKIDAEKIKQIQQVGQDGNGGGGVSKNGKVMTFYSAKIWVDPDPQQAIQVPMLQETIDFFAKTKYLTAQTKSELVQALSPINNRQYYKVKEEELDPVKYNEILSEYQRATGLSKDQIVIFALTDNYSRTTLLLPSFYKLNPHEQMAILFHESLWLNSFIRAGRSEKESLDIILKLERVFQASLDDPSPQNIYKFAQEMDPFFVGSVNSDVVVAAVQSDLETKALDRLAPNGKVSLKDFAGEEYVNCVAQSVDNSLNLVLHIDDCKVIWDLRIQELRKLYPQSMILNFFADYEFRGIRKNKNSGNYISLDELETATITLYSNTFGPFIRLSAAGTVLFLD